MAYPGTAADDTEVDDGTETATYNPYAVRPPELTPNPDLGSVYRKAEERLRNLKLGMTGKQRLGALLIGLGRPTPTGRWQDMVGNAAASYGEQFSKSRETDEARRLKLEQMLLQGDIADANYSSRERVARDNIAAKAAGKTGGGALNAEEKALLRIARGVYPKLTQQEILDQNLLGSNAVKRIYLRDKSIVGAAAGGYDVAGAVEQINEALPDENQPAPDGIPKIKTPAEGAQHPNSPVVNTPMGMMKNPFYKGR